MSPLFDPSGGVILACYISAKNFSTLDLGIGCKVDGHLETCKNCITNSRVSGLSMDQLGRLGLSLVDFILDLVFVGSKKNIQP